MEEKLSWTPILLPRRAATRRAAAAGIPSPVTSVQLAQNSALIAERHERSSRAGNGRGARGRARESLYFLKAIKQFRTTISLPLPPALSLSLSLSLSLLPTPTYFIGSPETAQTRKSSNYSYFRGSSRRRRCGGGRGGDISSEWSVNISAAII